MTCLLAVACACSSSVIRDDGAGDNASHAGVAVDARAGGFGFELINSTGSTLRAVYISPGKSKGWEENVLGGDELGDGDAVRVSFSPEEMESVWDMKVESADGRYAEWKALGLRDAARVTLLIGSAGESAAVAEIE